MSWELIVTLVVNVALFAAAIGRSEMTARGADKKADEAQRQIVIINAAHSMFREQVAREYVTREVLREMEERITRSIDRIGERLDKILLDRGGA